MLHIVKSSPFSDLALEQALSRMLPHDSLLLIGDGCYALSLGDKLFDRMADCARVWVLQSDAQMRGIQIEGSGASSADYAKFVELTLEQSNVISW